jgi:hypothetical protein
VIVSSLFTFACTEPATPPPAANASKEAPPVPSAPPPPAQRAPIGVVATEWPNVEARLIRLERTGQLVSVEIELVNTSAEPVTVADYSAREATMTDAKSGVVVEPFAGRGQPIATHALTATIAPGQSAVVSASFPSVQDAERVTLVFPKISPFESMPVVRTH